MDKMFANMLKAAGLDPAMLEQFISSSTEGIRSFNASLGRIEENQAEILRRLDLIAGSDDVLRYRDEMASDHAAIKKGIE